MGGDSMTTPTQDRAIYSVILGFVILAIILGGIFYLISQNADDQDGTTVPIPTVTPAVTPITTVPATDVTPTPESDEDVLGNERIEIDMSGSNFAFSPSQIIVPRGSTVVINFTNDDTDDMEHDVVIDGLGVATSILDPGQSETIEFVVDEPGTYTYYCSVGSHRAMGMVGTLIVE